ncbi:MAG TPA: hypothetical protein VF066_18555 [Thermoleophilaceae bacterium]
MRKRLLNGATAFTLALSLGTFGVTGVALAGEDDSDDTPPAVQPAPEPTTPQPVPVEPAPAPAPAPAPVSAPEKTTVKSTKKKSSSHSSGSSNTSSPSRSSTTPVANTSVDTGIVPQGGIQAGAGGTAADSSSPLLIALALGFLAFGVTSGGVALRRRSFER